MRWLEENTSALTTGNRAEAYSFSTRRDKSAAATAAWQPMTFGNLGLALAWYRMQQILVLCPDYGTLQQTDPRAAAAVKEKAGQMLLVDAVPDQRFIDQVVGEYQVDLSTLTIGDAFGLEQSRVRRHGMKSMEQTPVATDTMEIWTVTGERPAPTALGNGGPARPARPSGVRACR